MKVLVAIKRVVDYNVKIHINDQQSNVELDGIKMSMNPFCEIAVEKAVRLKEQGQANEIVVVSIGDSKTKDQLRHALAIGADRAILVEENTPLTPLNIAKVLYNIVQTESPDLVLLGKQSIDGDNGQTGAMLSALMDAPIADCAAEIQLDSDSSQVRYETDNGEANIQMTLPAVITADLRLAEPRFVKLPNIMKAKKKPLSVVKKEQLSVDYVTHQKRIHLERPADRTSNTILCDSSEQLAQKISESLEATK
ncbi:electron transfer flavoprotein subunit beta/FixA family protein [Vibrio sp. TH_r3]|uniref:electron transfer flavoprotein subunit beta/FixA family protein n=1 Tax=Vibrio sp. TH_r3 TaxID=3082084 RepID=UPI0029545EB2|nr:electron transfer flavoprotein subunit beta/FixA family protein [Vibrio sp. TH_r3]MDV7105610.1 electron transfer flavoprotein subunit beta/FixA family protein [Vibrio sp. TH_r3]